MEIKPILIEIGLAENQATIYLTLLKIGSSSAGEITKKCDINRTNVYDALERLIEKGIVSFIIKDHKKYFEARNPENLKIFLDTQEKNIQEKKQKLKQIFPKINKLKETNKKPQQATIFKGKKALKSIAEDVLKQKQELLVLGAEGKFKDIFDHYFDQWHLKRKKAKIKIKIVYNKNLKRNFPYSEIKINKNLEDIPSTTWIYADKIVIIVWDESPVATLIKSKEVSNSYREFFKTIWKNSKKI